MSSTPHSSASHHNSAVLVELRSTTGMNFPIPLTRSTKSLQLPSPSASSVITRVPLWADSSKPEAALMLRANSTVMPQASSSFSILGPGPVLATMMTALGSFFPGITSFARLHASRAQFRIAVSYRLGQGPAGVPVGFFQEEENRGHRYTPEGVSSHSRGSVERLPGASLRSFRP
jgi:hypothetical protein